MLFLSFPLLVSEMFDLKNQPQPSGIPIPARPLRLPLALPPARPPDVHGLQHAACVMAASHRQLATAADLQNALLTLVEHLDQPFDLALHAGHLDGQRLRRQVHNARAEDLDSSKTCERERGIGMPLGCG